MKLVAARKGVMVRIKSGGSFVYITSDHPVEVNIADPDVESQIATMLKLGWIVEVKEASISIAQGKEGQESQRGSKKSQQKNSDEAVLVE